jgi:hypothetical protein
VGEQARRSAQFIEKLTAGGTPGQLVGGTVEVQVASFSRPDREFIARTLSNRHMARRTRPELNTAEAIHRSSTTKFEERIDHLR